MDDSPYRPRFVSVAVPRRALPHAPPRPSRFDGGLAVVLFALCAALPIALIIAAMCHHGRTP